MKIIIGILVALTILLTSCSDNPAQISGAVAADAGLDNDNQIGQDSIEITQANEQILSEIKLNDEASKVDQNNLEMLENKKKILQMVTSNAYDKIEVSILLNDISEDASNQPIIDSWNALQRCVNCPDYSSLKQDFIKVLDNSIPN